MREIEVENVENTKIDYVKSTWNPVTGCLHGCEYCYARGIANRFGGYRDAPGKIVELDEPVIDSLFKREPYPYNFTPTLHRYRLNEYRDRKGRNIFVCSMADLFGDWIPDSWIEEVFDACDRAPQHNYLFLSKNPKRYAEAVRSNIKSHVSGHMDNYWFGTTVTTNSDVAYNSYELSETTEQLAGTVGKINTFVSIEPLLEKLLSLSIKWLMEFDWIIVGAETGRRKGKIIPERRCIESIVEQCKITGTPLFMKSSLADVWGEPLIQEFPVGLRKLGL